VWASIRISGSPGREVVTSTFTDAEGYYVLRLPAGTFYIASGAGPSGNPWPFLDNPVMVIPGQTVIANMATYASPQWGVFPHRLDYSLPNGHFYTQTNGQSGVGCSGYAVTDADAIPFYSTFNSFKLEAVGYPASRRFTFRGFTTQVFQKLVFQWQPGNGVFNVNVFDELHEAGKDPWLLAQRSVPPLEDTSPDTGLPWEQVVIRHLNYLDRDPVLKRYYLAEPRWYWPPATSSPS